MPETWTILAMEIVGGAKRATVRHLLPDGGERVRSYSWPAAITRQEIIATVDALHAQVVTETPAQGYDDGMDLVGAPRER